MQYKNIHGVLCDFKEGLYLRSDEIFDGPKTFFNLVYITLVQNKPCQEFITNAIIPMQMTEHTIFEPISNAGMDRLKQLLAKRDEKRLESKLEHSLTSISE